MSFRLQIVAPDRTLLDEEVASASMPTAKGEITILPHHIPLVTTIVGGEARFRRTPDGPSEHVHVGEGFLEVAPGAVTVLVDAAEHVEHIDEEKARTAIGKAQARLRQLAGEKRGEQDIELAETHALLARNLARMNIVRRRRHRQ